MPQVRGLHARRRGILRVVRSAARGSIGRSDRTHRHPRGSGPPRPGLPTLVSGCAWLLIAIDNILLGAVLGNLLLSPLMGKPGGIPANDPWFMFTNTSPQVTALMLLFLMGNWVYFAVLESSPWRATLGKKALGLSVVDLSGNRISFARASGRFFAKILSSMTFLIGFVMAGFTAKKQALHDMLAGCLVTRKI